MRSIVGEPESRRLVNLSWILSILSFWLLGITLLFLIDLSLRVKSPSYIAKGLNNNMLFLFVVANITTGIVSGCMQTLLQPPWVGFVIVCSYSLFWTAIAFCLGIDNYMFAWTAERPAAAQPASYRRTKQH
eukprot:GHVS01047436.1.p1 GENE.GHVS01047436.1~~GHVS01047436.1.p1  ORF type:complete len:131 (+),score=6.76 GHVS01047436.1:2-394(+)